MFLIGTSWEGHAWYLRLPSTPDVPGAPWAGVVRCPAATDLSLSQLTALANLSQTVLCRYASVAYKDSRAPENLVPIGRAGESTTAPVWRHARPIPGRCAKQPTDLCGHDTGRTVPDLNEPRAPLSHERYSVSRQLAGPLVRSPR